MFSLAQLPIVCDGDWLLPPLTDSQAVHRVSTDSRETKGALFVCLRGERFDAHDFIGDALANQAAAICVERNVSGEIQAQCRAAGVPVLRVAQTLRAYGRLGQAHRARFPQLKMVAVTGSCGKTSTREMIRALLEAHAPGAVLATTGNTNNFIGVPQNLLRLQPHHRFAVLELGTNAPGEIAWLTELVAPDVAVLSNIGPVHLERLGDINGVAREKSAIFRGLDERHGMAVLPSAWHRRSPVKEALPEQVITFGEASEAQVRVHYEGGDLTGSRFSLTLPQQAEIRISWGLSGRHQAENAAAAAAATFSLGADTRQFPSALATCHLPGMRMRVVEHCQIRWINDAYNANPASVRALVDWLQPVAEGLGDNLILVLGDMLELGADGPKLHRKTLEYARKTLPHARIWTVGPILLDCPATTSCNASFDDAEAAGEALSAVLRPGLTIALKGSRGIHLEHALPEALR